MAKDCCGGEDIIENGRLLMLQVTRSFGRPRLAPVCLARFFFLALISMIGDFPAKRLPGFQGVIMSEPEFNSLRFDKRCHILILASDGACIHLSRTQRESLKKVHQPPPNRDLGNSEQSDCNRNGI